jgi:hypothetical protein
LSSPALRHALALLIACTIAAIVSLGWGQDANWDLQNYHLYNPWAWINGRYGYDLAPAQVQTFHNPLLDLPLHAMVAAQWPPRVIAVALALPAGIAGYLLALVCSELFDTLDANRRRVAISAALAIGLTGVAGFATVGTTMNEWPGAALGLAALLVLLRAVKREDRGWRSMLVAGLCAGLACGLKLTAATSVVALGVALVVRGPWRISTRQAVVFGAASLGAFAIAAAPWMALMQSLYESPLFPYFNELFRSPLYLPESIRDQRFGPKTLVQVVRLPFDLYAPRAGYVAEIAHRDARFPLLALLAVVALALRTRPAAVAPADPRALRAWRLVAIYGAAFFVLWAALYSIYRYLLPLEVLSGALIVALVLRVVPPRAAPAALIVITAALIATTRYPNWGHIRFGPAFLDVRLPPVEGNALVLLTADAPLAHLATRFPTDARFAGIDTNLIRYDRPSPLRAAAQRMIDEHRGPLYQLTPKDKPAAEVLKAYGLRRVEGACGEVSSNLDRSPKVLCRVERSIR